MEKVIFDMPSDPEMFLAALSAVQCWRVEQELQIEHTHDQIDKIQKQNEEAYRKGLYPFGKYALLCNQGNQYKKDAEKRQHDISIHLPSGGDFDIFRPAFGSVTFVDDYKPERGDWDLAYQFTYEKAWAVAAPTEKHAAIAMGLLVGAETGSLPDLSAVERVPVNLVSERIGVLLIPWGDTEGYKNIVHYLFGNKPDIRFEAGSAIDIRFWQVDNSDMVVGPRCAATYIASALGKKVVELYPDNKYKRWLSKWDNPNYSMIYGKTFPASQVWRAMETLWDRPMIDLTRAARTVFSQRSAMGGLSAGVVDKEL